MTVPERSTIRTDAPTPSILTARREIARLRDAGKGWTAIAADLNARAVPTPSGRGRWWPNTVYRHLRPDGWAGYMRHYRAQRQQP